MLTRSHPPSACSAREAASARLDGELSELEAAQLDAHLLDCAGVPRRIATGARRRRSRDRRPRRSSVRAAPRCFTARRRAARLSALRGGRRPRGCRDGSSFAVGRVLGAARHRTTSFAGTADAGHVRQDSTQQHLLAMLSASESAQPTRTGRMHAGLSRGLRDPPADPLAFPAELTKLPRRRLRTQRDAPRGRGSEQAPPYRYELPAHIKRRESMHRRLWLLAGAAAAVLAVAASATATTKVAGTAKSADVGRGAVRPGVGQRPADAGGRKAKDVLVFGAGAGHRRLQHEPDVLQPVLGRRHRHRAGRFAARSSSNNKRQYVKDLVSTRIGDEDDALVHDPPGRELVLGRQEDPGHVQGLRLHVAADRRPEERRRRPRPATTRSPATPTRARSRSRSSGRSRIADLAAYLLRRSSIRRRRSPARTSTRSGRTASAVTTASPSPTVRSMLTNYTKGQGSTLKANPFWYGKKPGLERGRLQDHHRHEHRGPGHARRRGRRDLPDLRHQPAPAQEQSGRHLQPGPGLLPGAPRHPVRPEGRNPLLRAPWMRQAIMLGIDRQSIIKTVYGDLAGQHEAAEQHRSTTRPGGVQA